MSNLTQTLKSYFWWTYPRGTVPYDVMVTLILAFIFVAPIWINFRDKPVVRVPQHSEVVVQQSGDGFLYKVDASAVQPGGDAETRESLLRIIEPISGYVTIERVQAVRNDKQNVVTYNVWAHR